MNEILKGINQENANYICGFVDGEGSFNISFKIRRDYKQKIKLTASFNISQKELNILTWIKSLLHCGTIRARRDGVYYYEVTSLQALLDIIIPFFDTYYLKTKKLQAFSIFKKIVDMMKNHEHLKKEGILKIYDLRDTVKVARQRKFSRAYLESILNSD